jgi:hypothetical protein
MDAGWVTYCDFSRCSTADLGLFVYPDLDGDGIVEGCAFQILAFRDLLDRFAQPAVSWCDWSATRAIARYFGGSDRYSDSEEFLSFIQSFTAYCI